MKCCFGADGSVRKNHLPIHLGKRALTRAALSVSRYGALVCLLLGVLISSEAPRKSSSLADNPSSLPSTNPCAAESGLTESARALHAQGDFNSSQTALKKYDEALRCLQSTSAHREAAETLRSIGEIYYEIGQYESAQDAYQRAIGESKKIGDVRGRILSLIAIGMMDGELDRANDLLARTQEAQALEAQVHDPHLQAQIQTNYVFAHISKSDLASAGKSADAALALAEPLKDPNIYGKALLFAGYVKNGSGQLNDALDYYQRALSTFQRNGGPFWQSRALTAICGVYVGLGELQRTLEYAKQASTILERLHNRRWQGVNFNNMGYAYRELGDYQRALENYSNALACFRELAHEDGQAQTSVFIGNMHRLLGDFEKARENYEFANQLGQKLNDNTLKGMVASNLALLSQAEGNLPAAIKGFSQALNTYRDTGNQRAQIINQNALGNALYRSGQGETALRYLQPALALGEKTQDRELEVLVRYNLAQVESSLGHLDDARVQIEKSVDLIESLRLKLARFELRSSYFASVRQFYELYAGILMALHQQHPHDGLDAKAFEVSERARARSLLDYLQQSEINIRADADTAVLEQERTVQHRMNEASVRRAQLSANPDSAEMAAVLKEIDALTTQYEELQARIRSNSARLAAASPPPLLSLKDSQLLLDDNSLLLEYMLGDDRSYVWVVTRTDLQSFELPPRSQIESEVEKFRQLLTANLPVAGEAFEESQQRIAKANQLLLSQSANLGKMLLAPVADLLANKRLLIVPDGRLQSIPFQALALPDITGVPVALVERHEIAYEPSASALATVRQANALRKSGSGSVAVFANPVFDANDPRVKQTGSEKGSGSTDQAHLVKQAFRDVGYDTATIPPLPASREEADAIFSVIPWLSGLKAIDFQASRGTIGKTDFTQYRVVHFATHGFVDYEHPELSGLVFSMVDEKGNPQDGFLRMHDIYNLKLPVDLVVLSACNTGLGREIKGEGLIGLTRGFMFAGARGVVASLWKVDDDATAELMKHFYAAMFQKGLTPAAALRDAQLALRSRKRWESPYYWAAFVIQGEYDQKQLTDVPRVSFNSVTLGAGICVLAAGAAFLFRRKRKRAPSV
jgi:CHAT domain-containing protein/predicted negative regulator of RcsB-dependent stress response